jgi:hypothetical protein
MELPTPLGAVTNMRFSALGVTFKANLTGFTSAHTPVPMFKNKEKFHRESTGEGLTDVGLKETRKPKYLWIKPQNATR